MRRRTIDSSVKHVTLEARRNGVIFAATVAAVRTHRALPVAASFTLLAAAACTTTLPDSEPLSQDWQSGISAPAESSQSRGGPQSALSDGKESQEAAESAEELPDLQAIAREFEGKDPAYWGLDVPGVLNGHGGEGVALTLDACGGPGGSETDLELIEGLRARQIPATLFVNSRWVEENRKLTEELAVDPLFELANHGTSHRPLSVSGESAYGISGTGSVQEVIDEVWQSHLVLTEITGEEPRYFRSGTAHYDELAVQIASQLGYEVIGFTVNADAGATYSASEVREHLLTAGNGSVVIAHFNQPGGGTAPGMLGAIDEMLQAGEVFVPLENPE